MQALSPCQPDASADSWLSFQKERQAAGGKRGSGADWGGESHGKRTFPQLINFGGFMSKIKSLILGSAAALVAATGAQAADLPVKAKAVQYVKICSLYGAGFYYIPGTDTCIKLGGYVQLTGTSTARASSAGMEQQRQHRSAEPRVGLLRYPRSHQLNIDTRTATEYGVVRTYWSSNFQHDG
jgi:hypothetical protein